MLEDKNPIGWADPCRGRNLSARTINHVSMTRFVLFLLLFLPIASPAQTSADIRICTYNVLHLGDDDYDRAAAYRTVLSGIAPDVLVCQEINNVTGIVMLLDSALNRGVEGTFRSAPFNNGPDTDNALLYNAATVEFIEARYHPTALRDIAEYVVLPVGSADTLVIFTMHLKAGDDAEARAQRVEEAKIVRGLLEKVPDTRTFIVAGDLNFYSSDETAYTWLTDPAPGEKPSVVVDPMQREGDWHDRIEFADVHTQSTRGRRFGGGLEGGVDDRFDFILLSQRLFDRAYAKGSYTTYGNDGNHFNDSINAMPNAAVAPDVAQALHDASDHLPVFLDLEFGTTGIRSGDEAEMRSLPMGIW